MSLDEIIQHHAPKSHADNTVEFEVSGKYGLFTDPIEIRCLGGFRCYNPQGLCGSKWIGIMLTY